MSTFSVSLLRGSLPDGAGWLFPLLLLTPYLLVSLALGGLVAMHLTIKRGMAAQAKRNRRVEAMLLRLKEATSAAALGASGCSGGPVRGQLDAGFDLQPPAFAPARPPAGMNISRRVQALRLLRRGEDLGYIASALAVPRCEVELLVRVQRLAMTAACPEQHLSVPAQSSVALTAT